MRNKNEKSLFHKRLILRPACLIFSLVLLVSSVLPSWAVTLSANIAAAAEAEALAAAAPMASGSVPYAEAFGKIADPYLGFTDFADSTLEDGRLWTDKSVSANQAIIYDSAGKPVGSETAGEDEFLVALSAMTQAFKEKSEIPTPSDTVLVIDISLSMVTSKVNGISRLSMMIDALNEAITILTMANPENRIAVVAFGGESGKSRVCQILRLESYYKYCDDDPVVPDIPDVPGTSVKQFFSLPSPAFLQVDPNIPKEMLTDGLYRIRANGGTSTQQGIYYGAQQLLKNPDTTFTATLPNNTTTTMTRKPNIVLLTDGEPTLGWTDYKFDRYTSTTADGFDCGNAEDVNMGIEILTVLTATHFKNAVHDYYYGTADTAQTVGFYNIGLGVGGSEDASAVLDPLGETGGEVNASLISKSYSGQVYNMKDALDSFVGSAGTASFPALEKDAERLSQLKLVTVRNTGTKSGRDLNSYDYSDRYITASNGDTLREAFKSVVQHIASSASYTTELSGSGNPGNVGDPNYEGLVVFSDVLGEYMEYESFKGIWFDNHEYDGHYFAQRIKNDQNEAFLKEMADIFAGHSQYFGIDQTTAISLLRSAKKAGEKAGAVTDPADKGIYYTNAADYSNRIRYYANAGRDWIGNYFNADGTKAAEPANAASIVDLYPVAGVTYNTVGDAPSNVRYSTFRVITALKDGEFAEMESDGTKMVRYLRAGQQMVRWYIPASLIPVRIVSGSGNALQITETVPIRAIYSVGLNEELLTLHEDDASANNNEYGEYKAIDENNETGNDPISGNETYYFYTNDWNRPSVTDAEQDNQSMVYFTPASENPYYFYVEDGGANTGKVPLYIYNSTDYEEVTSGAYNSGTTYYAKTMYYDISSGSTEKARYDAVDHSVITTNDGFPYIKANTAKPEASQTAKTANATKTDAEAAREDILALDENGDSVADNQVWRNLLGNNGRLEVKYTGLWVIKEWDGVLYSLPDEEKAEAIKMEYAQLYSNISGVEKSIDNPQALDPTNTPSTIGNITGAHWSGLPVYEKKVDSGGNTEFVQYTVKEGSYKNQVFDPYDEDSETPYFNVTYIQPVWERTTEEMGYARVINSSGYDLRWFMTIEKLFAGIDPAKVGDIEFALYASEDLGQTYVQVDLDYDVTKMTRTYPGGFTDNKFEAVMFAKSGTVQNNPMHFLLVEKGAEVSGYDWTVSLEGNEVKEITEDSHSFKIGTRDDKGNLTEDLHAIVTGDRVFEIKGVDPEEIAYFKLTNNYTPEEPGLTLQKSYNGSSTAAANHDITFIVEGWADEAAFTAKDLTKRIFYDTVSSGLLNYANQTGKAAGKITFPVDQALEHEYAQKTAGYQEVNHPQLLPTGCYYTITEEYDDFVDNGYTYEVTTTATIGDVGGTPAVLPEIDPTAIYPMYGFAFNDNDNLSVSLTNTYEQRQRLIIKKVFEGTVPSPIPDDITFTVVQNPGAAENIVKDISYSEFTGGEYIINDLPAGTYVVREEIDGNQAVGYEVATKVEFGGTTENDRDMEVTLSQSGADATVIFTNTYTESTADLVIEKELDQNGYPGEWNINDQTIFSVVIKDVADPDPSRHSYLIFDGNNKLLGKSVTLGGATKLSVSVDNPVTVVGLPIGGQYEVVEQKPDGAVFTTDYSAKDSSTGGQYVSTGSDAGKIMMTTGGGTVKITNLYPLGKGSLIIAKELLGDYAGWGIPPTKTFPVRVFDKDQNGYLLFVETASAGSRSSGGYYKVIGLEKDLAAVSAKPEYQGKVILGELPVSAAGPIVVEVDWPSLGVQSVNYRVEEVVNPGETAYDVTYSPTPEITLDVASQNNETVTITNDYDDAPGNLNITKRLAGSPGDWGVDGDTIFKAKVKVVTNGNDNTAGEYLNFKNNAYDSTDATGSLIEFSVNNPASLTAIPEGTYAVEEISSGTSYTVSYSGVINNNEVEIVSNQSKNVEVINTYVHDVGKAIIKKTLSGSYGDWGINRDTEFTAEVYEKEDTTANERLLYFVKTGANTYRCVGNEEYGPSEPVNGSYLTSITFSENSPALLENLYVGSEYIVKEADDSNASSKETYYPGNSATLPQDGINAVGNIDITVINTYDSSKNRIIIEKKLDGSYTDWGVDNKTSFKAKIFYKALASIDPEEQLSFEKNPDGSYKCITFGGDTPTPDVSEVEFTQEKSAVLTGLAPGQYWIEENDIASGEVNDDHYTAAYTDTDETADDKIVTLTTAQEVTHTVRVTNTYEPGQTLLILEKKLENNEDWGITENTVFHARVKQVDANGPGKDGYIEFARGITATDTYHAVGSGADGFIPKVTDTDYVISFTARQPVILTGLVADHDYVVEEFPPTESSGIETEKIEYQVNGGKLELTCPKVLLKDDIPVTVTVTNAYPAATAKMTIEKGLANAGAWGVDDDTVFRARVVDITDPNSHVTQVFEMTPGRIYRRVSSSYAAGRGSEVIEFSVKQPARLEGLLPGQTYKVEEESGSNFTASYAYANNASATSITLAQDDNETVKVTNSYDANNSLLKILKDFSGDSRAWDPNREFKVQLYYEDAQNQKHYIKFSKDAKGNYYAESPPPVLSITSAGVDGLLALPVEEAEATATLSATPESSDPAATGTATPTVVPAPSGDPTATGTATPTVAPTPSGNPTATGTATPTVAPTPSINPEETGTAAPAPADEPAMATPSVIPAATDGPVATDEPVANEIPAVTDEPLVTDTPAITKGSAATDISATTDGSVATDTPEATEKSVVTEAAANAPTPSVIPVAVDRFGASGITVRSGSNAALGAVMRSGTRGSVPLSMRGISVRFAGLALSGTGTTLVASDTTEVGNRISAAGTGVRVNLTDTRNSELTFSSTGTTNSEAVSGSGDTANPEAASGLTDTVNPEVVSGSGDTTNQGATTNPADAANPGATTIPSGTANPEASAPDSTTQPSATSEPTGATDPEGSPDSTVTPGPSGSPAPGTTPDPSGSAAPGITPDPSGTPDPANPDMLSVMAEDVNLLAEAHDTEEYMITLKAGVPVNVFGLTLGYKYAVEEIDVNSREVDPMVEYNGDKDPVELEANEMIEVVISNLYAVPTESLEIKKVLAGSNYASWGVNSATKFPVRIKNVDKNRYLIIGADNYFLELAAYEDDLGTTLYVSESSPLIVKGLPVDENYVVEEVVDIDKTFSPTYAGYDAGRTYFTMRDLVGGASTPAITITITNDYPIPRPPDPPAPPAPPNPPGGSTTTVSNPPPEDGIAKVTPSPTPSPTSLPDWELPVDENPPTGDTANTSFWLLVLAGAALASLALVLLSRKKAR